MAITTHNERLSLIGLSLPPGPVHVLVEDATTETATRLSLLHLYVGFAAVATTLTAYVRAGTAEGSRARAGAVEGGILRAGGVEGSRPRAGAAGRIELGGGSADSGAIRGGRVE